MGEYVEILNVRFGISTDVYLWFYSDLCVVSKTKQI